MKQLQISPVVYQYEFSELDASDQALVNQAIASTAHSYAPYSGFHVGAAVLLDNGLFVTGSNQENAAYGVTLCAERTALFSAAAQYPDAAVVALAIAARDSEGLLQAAPVTPCGSCRQAIAETERRFGREVRLLLYGTSCVYVAQGIRQLLPLTFEL